jgi:hypothetical protein
MQVVKCLAAAGILAALISAGCSRTPEPTPPAGTAPAEKAEAGWPGFVDSFIQARFEADPYFAVQTCAEQTIDQKPNEADKALTVNANSNA